MANRYQAFIYYSNSPLLGLLRGQQVLLQHSESLVPMRDGVLDLLVHLSVGLGESLGLKARVPPKMSRSPWGDNLSLGSSFKDCHFLVSRLLDGDTARGFSGKVIKPDQGRVETLGTEFLQEPLDIGTWKANKDQLLETPCDCRLSHLVGPPWP